MQKVQRIDLTQSKLAGGCNKCNTTVIQTTKSGNTTTVVITTGKK